MIITNPEKVLRTIVGWWDDGTLTFPGYPRVSSLVNFIHSNFEVLKSGHPGRSYGKSRLRYFIDEYLEEVKLKKEEKRLK